jgi:hypothetical protein
MRRIWWLRAWQGSCGENCIPDFGRSFAFEAKLADFELTFPDPMHEFDGRCCMDIVEVE